MICKSCLGKKTLLALGGIIKDCPICEGTGMMNDSDSQVEIKTKRHRRTKEEIGLCRQEEAVTE